jgi:predicted adenylyl cyclase CyaB
MSRNVEIKARIDDAGAMRLKVAEIADDGPIEILQDDTFYHCDTGRLKLRLLSEHEGELIFYRRADNEGPKESFYLRSLTTTPITLRDSLEQAYGIAGRVQKCRTLFWMGRTRIHIDRVEGLGDYLELEVVLSEGEPVKQGIEEAIELMRRLGVDRSQLVKGAYVDLISARGA